jgi:H+-translocating NAD(P) transhydrogenase subunit alpha
VLTENGITIIGAGSLPSTMPAAASAMYARNITALLLTMVSGGELALDGDDELHAGVIITSGGAVVHPALAPPAAGQAGSAANESSESDDAGGPDQAAGSAEGNARVSGPAS